MAAPINVPASQREALRELASLSDEAYRAVHELIDRTGSSAEASSLIEHTSRALATQTRLGGQILGTIIGLRSLVDRSALPINEIVEAVASDAASKRYIPEESKETFKRRLAELLQMEAVTVSAKAFSLAMTDAAPFNDVRIVSDVRPIFSSSESELELAGSIIVHHMHIEVSGPNEDQYCALTSADLLKLRRAVERAIEKDKKLRNALRGGPLAALESQASASERES